MWQAEHPQRDQHTTLGERGIIGRSDTPSRDVDVVVATVVAGVHA